VLTTTRRLFSITASHVIHQVPEPAQIVVFKQPWLAMVGMFLVYAHPIEALPNGRHERYGTTQLERHSQEEEQHTIQPIQCGWCCR
jgi:hypothetical protein